MNKKNQEVNAKNIYKHMSSLMRLSKRLEKHNLAKDAFAGNRLFTYTPREYKQTAN